MKKVYACLAGKWVCLNDDPDCVMGSDHLSPTDWYKLTHDVYAPVNRREENDYYHLDYINIHYLDKDYRINPVFIQIVTED